MDKSKTCFFTGHRRIASERIEFVKEKLEEYIEILITQHDVNRFIAGGAIGFDTMSAEIVIKMREKYPHIKLVLYLPCYKQSAKWSSKNKYNYRLILSRADEYKYVTESEYVDGCMKIRNLEMIKDSSFCIAFCIMYGTGTGFTLRNAEAVGVEIKNIADEIY